MKVCQVSNAGILLSEGDFCIGVDVFTKDQTGIYPDLPELLKCEILQMIKEGRLCALFFTHEHGDHFYAKDVYEAWKLSPNLRIFGTEEVARQLIELGIPKEKLTIMQQEETQIQSLGIFAFGENTILKIKGMNALHEGAAFAKIQNVVYLMEYKSAEEERHYLIAGDAMPQEILFQKIAAEQKEIHGCFVPFPYVGKRAPRKWMDAYLQVEQIFVLHAPKKELEEYVWIEKTKSICKKAKDGIPEPIFAEMLGKECYKML